MTVSLEDQARDLLSRITPGLWTYRDIVQGRHNVTVGNYDVASCSHGGAFSPDQMQSQYEQAKNNAVFIAAAPRLVSELLEKLSDTQRVCDDHHTGIETFANILSDENARLRSEVQRHRDMAGQLAGVLGVPVEDVADRVAELQAESRRSRSVSQSPVRNQVVSMLADGPQELSSVMDQLRGQASASTISKTLIALLSSGTVRLSADRVLSLRVQQEDMSAPAAITDASEQLSDVIAQTVYDHMPSDIQFCNEHDEHEYHCLAGDGHTVNRAHYAKHIVEAINRAVHELLNGQ